jgi:hypothetical protein
MEHAQTVQPEPTQEEKRHHGGRPWTKGVSGNPSGSKISKRFAELHTAMLAEFAGVALTASDLALLERAARLLARRMRDDLNAVRATNAARLILSMLHARHRKVMPRGRPAATSAPEPRSWSPRFGSSLNGVKDE